MEPERSIQHRGPKIARLPTGEEQLEGELAPAVQPDDGAPRVGESAGDRGESRDPIDDGLRPEVDAQRSLDAVAATAPPTAGFGPSASPRVDTAALTEGSRPSAA